MDNCKCQQENADYSEYDELSKTALPTTQLRKIHVDFGKVAVCKEYVKTFTLEDLQKNTETISYEFRRQSVVNPIYHVFYLNKYEGLIKPGECLKLKIKYTPRIPNKRNLEIFTFVTDSSDVIQLIVTGETKGPLLRSSMKYIHFIKSPGNATCKRTFEIRNISNVPADFIFDCNKGEDVFKIDPIKGTIQGLSHLYVHAYFHPNEHGLYAQKLFCLTWCDAPLVIELFGVYMQHNDQDTKVPNFKRYPFPFEDTVGYDAYFQDNNANIMPISLNKYHIDFGRNLKENEPNSNPHEASITNLTNDTIVVKWPKDDIFSVVPRSIKILYNDTVTFSYFFSPKENNVLYSKMFTAQIDWISYHTSEKDEKDSVNIPITTTIRLQGHSFPEGESWISTILMDPEIVILPPCLPGHKSSSNFKICAKGHLPVMYRILSPKKTNIIMKPMVGVINGYTIVAVQLYTDKEQPKEVFDEQWYIVLNSREEKRIPLCIKGEVGVPQVLIGYMDNIRFESVLPECETYLDVPIKNISCFEIRFQFDTVGYDCIEFEPMTGYLTLNEERYIKCKYIGSKCIPNKVSLKCRLQTVQKIEEFIGELYEHTFNVHTKCVYSQLCATPNNHKFGKLQWGSSIETDFYLFNFGESAIYFQLSILYHSYNKNKMRITPKIGEVKPRDKIKITVIIRATTVGDHKIEISYGVRKSSVSNELANATLIHLYEIQFNCSFPEIQIQEIVEHSFGPLFGKKHFWQYFDLFRLNRILRTIKDGETRRVFLSLPHFEISQKEYYVTLLVKNITMFDTEVHLKRKQMCRCQLKEIPGHINIRKKAFDCPHKAMLTMELTDNKFYKKAEQLLTIRVKYAVPGETKMAYVLQLGDNRNVEIVFTIHTIPENTCHIALFRTEHKMALRQISVSQRVAPIQTIWLYNNTSIPAPYHVDDSEFKAVCQNDGFDVFKCLNPKGEIQPYSALPLMIKFHPIELKKYEVSVKLILGDRMIDFLLTGIGNTRGTDDPFSHRMPLLSNKIHNFPVTLSLDYISIDYLPVWSMTERVIFIKNVSKDKVIQYTWGDTKIDGVVEITTVQKSGLLKPKESRPVIIKIKSFNEACITDIFLSCKMLDYVQFVLFRKSLELYNMRQQQVEAEFTITDEGSFHEPNEIVVADLPEVIGIALCMNVNIVHTKDRDSMTLKEQFNSSPQDDVPIKVLHIIQDCFPLPIHFKHEYKILENAKVDDKNRIKTILEELISDFIFGNSFEEIFKTSEKLFPPIYNQITVGGYEFLRNKATTTNEDLIRFRKQLIRKVFSRPKLSTVSATLNELIKSTMIELFKLGKQNATENEIDQEVEKILQMCTTLQVSNASCKLD